MGRIAYALLRKQVSLEIELIDVFSCPDRGITHYDGFSIFPQTDCADAGDFHAICDGLAVEFIVRM